MEDIAARRLSYLRRLNEFNRSVNAQNVKPPREMIAAGVRKSTGISDDKTVAELTNLALKGDNYVKNGDYDTFLFSIAESLENTRCETTSQNEYFTWSDEGETIMKHMTDGCVDAADLAEKEDFIKDSYQREAELLTCLGLYEKSNNPLAKKRHQELMIKLQRLRQIRSALENGTKKVADKEPLTPDEQARMRATVQTLEDIREADERGDYQNADILQRMQELHFAHTADVEFYAGYSFYTRLLEEQRRAEAQNQTELEQVNAYAEHPDEYLVMLRHKDDSRDAVRERILRLTGRKAPQEQRQASIDDAAMRARHFDAQNFLRLKKMREEEEYRR